MEEDEFFHHLHQHHKFEASSLWSVNSRLHQRLFGTKLQKWQSSSKLLKHYESGKKQAFLLPSTNFSRLDRVITHKAAI